MGNQDLILAPDQGLSRLKWEYERERTGWKDLLCFGTADMDYRSPQPVLDALRDVVERGHLGYPMAADSFYSAVRGWLLRTTGWEIDARTCVGQNVGIYMSAWNMLDVLTRPGDKVTILTPVHFCFKRMIQLNGRAAIECPLLYEHGRYRINLSALEACFASGSRVLWMCNPHNPVGRAWRREELEQVAELCLRHQVYIMSDDVYCGLVFPGAAYTPIASLSREISYRTVTFYSISKSYNTAGLRHSFLVAENPELFKKYQESLEKLDLEYGLNIMGMAATAAAYSQCDGWLRALMEQIEKNYRFIADFFAAHLPGALVAESDAAYFAWADLRALGIPPRQLGYLIEQEEHMIVENGASLGKGGAGFIRINLAASEDHLREGVERFRRFWERHGG